MSEKEAVEIRLILDGNLAERFKLVKEYHGFENNTELVRHLITKEYERVKPLGKS